MKFKLLISLVLIIISGLAWVDFSPLPHYSIKKIVVSEQYSNRQITEGRRIAMTICIRCHYNEQMNSFAGKKHGNPKRLGDFNSGNITRDSATGIGAWSAGEIYYFLKTGIKPNGEYVFDMPKYPNLSENDLLSIVGFLKSDDPMVLPTNYRNPEPQFSLLTKLLLHTLISPPEYTTSKESPDTNNKVEFGRYLATAKFSCYECHSLNMVTTNYENPGKSWGFFKGGNPHVNENGEKIYTPNITGDTLHGIGRWDKKRFYQTLKNGIKADGSAVKDPMFPFYLLTDREVESIYVYLKSLPGK